MDQPHSPNLECAAAVAELQEQGLTVRLHSRENNTWHIADGGLYSGYVASSDELVDLRRANNLNICAIKKGLLQITTPTEKERAAAVASMSDAFDRVNSELAQPLLVTG
jgi:hypothetical protein